MDEMLSPAGLMVLLCDILAGAAGGTPAEWRERIGDVEVLPIALNPKSNWRVTPAGAPDEVHAIRTAADIVRAEHPYVSAPRGAEARPS